MKKKILLGITTLILILIIIFSILKPSYGTLNSYNNYTWYYLRKNYSEAINVYLYRGDTGEVLEVPSYCDGYPVTMVKGYDENNNIISKNSVTGASNRINKIILPDTLTTIGDYAFQNLSGVEIVLPESVRYIDKYAYRRNADVVDLNLNNITIGNYAFTECPNLKNAIIKNGTIGRNAFNNCPELESVTIINSTVMPGAFNNCPKLKVINFGEGVTNITTGVINNCPNADIYLSNDVKSITTVSFSSMTDVFWDNVKEDVSINDLSYYNYNPETNKYPYIHYKGDKQTIFANCIEGVDVINVATGEKITEDQFEIGENVAIKLEKQDGYNYDNLKVFIESENTYRDRPNVIEEVELDFGEVYLFKNLRRNKKIYIQDISSSDMAIKTFVKSIRNIDLDASREVKTQVENGKIKYSKVTDDLYARKGDVIKYTIRVYNQGNANNSATKIIDKIPEGLKFVENSSINSKYGWSILDEGKTATTIYLKDKTIDKYKGGEYIDYEDIEIELVVDAEVSQDIKELINTVEIKETSEEDVNQENDLDTEKVLISNNAKTRYALKINKIDGIDTQLLNGATFELLNENKEVIKTDVTANGGTIDFGMVEALGEGKTTYYIREIYTPEGYKNHLKYLVQVDIINEIINDEVKTKVELDVIDIDCDTSKYKTIDINTKEELMAMESNKQEKYVLKSDIDLAGENWTPLNLENVKFDGNNHKISNLTIVSDDKTNKKFGLFATYSGIIENLTLENVNIDIKKYVDSQEEMTKEYIDNLYAPEETEDEIHATGGIIGYAGNTMIKNCKVTGNVSSETNNVGALVGHNKKGTIIVFRGCVNEADVKTLKEFEYTQYSQQIKVNMGSNAGGMIGCALGPVYVTACTNKGEITAGLYNAGGMIGCAECSGYNTKYVTGKYDDDTKNVQIALKNEKIQGKYDFEIQKIDGTDSKLLPGAIFSIYDRNKQLIEGYENVELVNGKIQMPIEVDHIGSDVYYIKEVRAPLGYTKINNNYIKIEVIKTWDRESEEYNCLAETSVLSQAEFENDNPNPENSSGVSTNLIYDDQNVNVKWNINKVLIDQNTINEGKICSNSLNAGGFVGRATCSVTVLDSQNKAQVLATKGDAAGILGRLHMAEGKEERLLISNVQNYGDILGCDYEKEILSINYALSGLVAFTNANTQIYNSTNYNDVVGNGTLSGIVGVSVGEKLEIDNCINEGNLLIKSKDDFAISSSEVAGGIVGKSAEKDDIYTLSNDISSKHIITNCKNIGNIDAGSHVGGIIGFSIVDYLDINNCIVDEISLNPNNAGDVGGIIGHSTNETLILNDNIVNKINVINRNEDKSYNSNKGTGGVVGYIGPGSNSINKYNVIIDKCNISESNLDAATNLGGIIGIMAPFYSQESSLNIKDSNVENTILTLTGNGGSNQVGGILGVSCVTGDIEIDKCNVTDSELIYDPVQNAGYGNLGLGGIAGNIYQGNTFKIQNSKVNNTNITDKMVTDKSIVETANSAGVVAFVCSKEIEIVNTNVDTVKIIEPYCKAAGIVGSANVYYPENLLIDGCNINKLEIENIYNNNTSGNACIAAGMVGVSSTKNTVIQNSTLKNSTLNGNGQMSGVLCVSLDNNLKVNNTLVENTLVKSTATYDQKANLSVVSGCVGTINGTANIDGCNIKDSTVQGAGNTTSGIVGNINNGSIVNCEVNNTKVENIQEETVANSNINTALAGIIAQGKLQKLENCKVINGSKLLSKSTSTAGIWATYNNSVQNLAVKECVVEDTLIEGKSISNTKNYGTVAGIIADVMVTSMENCTLKNTNISGRSENIVGLIGATYYTGININGCTVEGLTINHINDIKSTASARNIGGFIGYGCGSIEDSTLKDLTININGESNNINIGGIVSIISGSKFDFKNNTIDGININNNGTTNQVMAGGISGFDGYEIVLDSTNAISNITINTNSKGLYGGLFAIGLNITLNGTIVNDINITNNTSTSSHCGGIVGFTYYGIKTDSNAKISNININNKSYGDAGSLVGFTYGNTLVDVENTEFSNINVYGTNAGGLIGNMTYCQSPKFKNLTLSNVEVKGKASLGGIVGQSLYDMKFEASNVTANNIKVNRDEQSTYSSPVGGLVGLAINPNMSDINICDINVSNLNHSSAALVGVASKPSTVSSNSSYTTSAIFKNINIDASNGKENNISLKYTQTGTPIVMNIGGIIGYSEGILTTDGTISIKNTNIEMTGNTTNNFIGGVVGAAQNYSSAKNMTFENLSINGSGYCGAIAGAVYNNGCQVSDIIVNNISVIGKNSTGGLLGVVKQTGFNKITANGLTAKTSTNNVGGLVGIVEGSAETLIANSTFNNLDVEATASGYIHVGGLVGIAVNPKITDVSIQDINIKNSGGGNTGGIVAIATKLGSQYSDNTVFSNAVFNKVTITKSENGSNIIIGAQTNTGILLGFGTPTTLDISISDVNINGSYNLGTIGMAIENSNIKDITLNNVNVTSVASGSSNIGGIVGFTKSSVESCKLYNVVINNNIGPTGGIAGSIVYPGSTTTMISNCEVYNSNIQNNNGYLGGIAGYSENTIKNCSVVDSNITEKSGINVGGILGHGSNVIGNDTTISNCSVIDSNISGMGNVGGVSGGPVAKISSCYVGKKQGETFEEGNYAVTIKGNSAVGGIIGCAGSITKDTQVMVTLQGNKVEDSLIEGYVLVDGVIGQHNSFGIVSGVPYSGTQVENISMNDVVNCVVNLLQ